VKGCAHQPSLGGRGVRLPAAPPTRRGYTPSALRQHNRRAAPEGVYRRLYSVLLANRRTPGEALSLAGGTLRAFSREGAGGLGINGTLALAS
jgi:hypothetical protein